MFLFFVCRQKWQRNYQRKRRTIKWDKSVLKIKKTKNSAVLDEIIFWDQIFKSFLGHGELLELRLLEKSARHDFIIARHHSSK
jgi:hypothetical protein